MHVNKTKFERNISLEYHHMTFITVSVGLTVGRKTAKNLDNRRKNWKKKKLNRFTLAVKKC